MFTSQNKNYCTILLSLFWFGLFSQQNLQADVIELPGNTKIYGQLISISEETVFIETLSNEDASIETFFLPRNKVIRITDESGIVLFSEDTQHIFVLKRYYAEMTNNWEELKDRFLSKRTIILLVNGKEQEGKIINITKQFLFLQKMSTGKPVDVTVRVDKISLKTIKKVGATNVLFIDPQKSHSKINKKIKYPVYSISGGVVYAHTNYDRLQGLFQEYYKELDLSISADKRSAGYLGGQAKFEIYIRQYLSFGFTGFIYNNNIINLLGITMAETKYTFNHTGLRPWLSAGFAGHSFRSSEKIGQTKYVWDTRKGTISFGLGIDWGHELGTGYVFSVHYLPFGKGVTKIEDSNISIKNKQDFTIFLISAGVRFNFN